MRPSLRWGIVLLAACAGPLWSGGGIWRDGLQTIWGGRHDMSPSAHFAGSLGPMRIYGRALPPGELPTD